ncbi:hypothetical protein T12_5423 [Trichinella patagoniensis]|uniref:Uncharacterized protein n=1 Tax=Trichinella patagoniensis TaxID=990121 RepID=A0A0V0ZV89_9BILA|nr:hypothetical protein T12_5423 [Trichinella patagoniensis]
MVELLYRNVFRHYNEVFVETAKHCAIFRCFWASRFSFIFGSGKFDGKQTRTSRINSPLNLPCAYLNTQGSSPSGTPLKRIVDVKFYDIIMRYSLKLPSFVQYFIVYGKSFFLHFQSSS